MPKVSIIMGARNCEKTIQKCIDSIFAQTFTDWEFIICDDASEDGTGQFLENFQKVHSEKIIVLHNKERQFLAYSLNKCLRIARGTYIARMDADDISLPERLEKQVNFLDTHPEYAVVGTAMIPFDESGTKQPRYMITRPQNTDLLLRAPFAHATIMMRKEAYDALDGYTVCKRTERGQDHDLWFRFYAAGFKGYNLPEALYLVLEDAQAMKRRTFRSRVYAVQTKIIGYRLLHYPVYRYIFALKPLVAAIVPPGIMRSYHRAKDKQSKKKV
ncbi:MAG: glycosyltransferase family 2 protein [Clostridia bacterium]|nr:glycosyltransferase family 2 protein [Clostridia bacterium]